MKTVLVVDDEDFIRDYLAAVLDNLGVKVLTADDGDTALKLMEGDSSIDLVILDLNMRRLNGWQTYPLLKELKADIKVIISSASIDASSAARLRGMKVDAILRKPFKMTDFELTVREILNG